MAPTSHDEASAHPDNDQLRRTGKVPELERTFGLWSMLGFGCLVMITWEAVLVVFGIGFAAGGYAGSFYGYLFVWLGTLAVFATMAELCSMAPTAAGQYHWVAMLAPTRTKRWMSYVIGWMTITGWIAIVASSASLAATLLQGLVSLTHPEYTASEWQIPLISWAIILFAGFFNTIGTTYLSQVESVLLILHIMGFFAIAVPVAVFSPKTKSAVVFQIWLNEGDWSSRGLSFIIGLIGPAFALLGGDSAVHMAEEIKNPSVNIPRAILFNITLNGAMGLAMLLVLLFSMSDPESVLVTSLGFPFIAIFQQAVGNVAGVAVMCSVAFTLGVCCVISSIATASRLIWAFARDHGLPGWRILAIIDPKAIIPRNAVLLVLLIVWILSLVGFGSSVAFNGIISLSINGLYTSYFIGNSLLLYRRLTGVIKPYSPGDNTTLTNTIKTDHLSWGPWKIREPWGSINNGLGCAYLLILLVFSYFPTVRVPKIPTMNWSSVMVVSVICLASTYYLIWGKKTYKGPRTERAEPEVTLVLADVEGESERVSRSLVSSA